MNEIKRYTRFGERAENGCFVRLDDYEDDVYARDHIINELEYKVKELEDDKCIFTRLIEVLESEKRINEIKAQGIEEAIQNRAVSYNVNDPADVIFDKYEEHLKRYTEYLRKGATDD